MKKNNQDLIECGENGHTITIEGLVDQLQIFTDWREITKYNITENFPKIGKCTYALVNLNADIEDGMAAFYDAEEILPEDSTRVLNNFMLESVLSVRHDWKEGTNIYTVLIKFEDGTISINGTID